MRPTRIRDIKMRRTIILLIGIVAICNCSFAQTSVRNDYNFVVDKGISIQSESETSQLFAGKSNHSFTRGDGFVIRPELYRGIFANFGYQINPYVQVYVGLGYSDGLDGALGLRAYTGDANWVAMFDLRFSVTNFALPGVALVAGASYKDLDFGAGLKYYTDGYYYLYVPVLTVGWNIRCYDHR